MERGSVVEFVQPTPPYHVGHKAFFTPEMAEGYVRIGRARMVAQNVPKVDPETLERQRKAMIEERAAFLAVDPDSRMPPARNRAG